jgi:hypothetical protein
VTSADEWPEVPRALFVGATSQSRQPGRLILLGNALWHRRQIFGVDPAITILLWRQDVVVDIGDYTSRVGRLCT